jgi:hypothetical protein
MGYPVYAMLKMKVLVADKFEQSGLDGLQALGCTVLYDPPSKRRASSMPCASTTPMC